MVGMTNAERQARFRERRKAELEALRNAAPAVAASDEDDDFRPSSSVALVSALNKRSGETSIEWTEATINPFVGCTRVSEGCRSCYAERDAHRFSNSVNGPPAYAGTTKDRKWTGIINRASDASFYESLKNKRPTVYFVCSMSDFWHVNVKDEWRKEFIEIMHNTPHHTYQLLTKRPENISKMLAAINITELPSNVWIGATVEDSRVKSRIDHIRNIPAKVRFLSVEPMTAPLGSVDLTGIHWVITGGESGPGARPCKVEWVREVRDQCRQQGVAFFHKQWGTAESNPLSAAYPGKEASGITLKDFIKSIDPHAKGGAFLDGLLFRAIPEFALCQ